MAAFQYYLQSGKQRKLGWVGDDSHFVFDQKFPGKRRSVRQCVVMMKPVDLLPKLEGEVCAHFHKLTVKRHSSMRNGLFCLPGRMLC
jgi:hypothetical protein